MSSLSVTNHLSRVFDKLLFINNMAKYKITKSKDNYYFTLYADNGRPVVKSQGFTSLSGCYNGIEVLKKYVYTTTIYETDSNQEDS